MAQPALDKFKRRGVAIKLEVTEGVDSIPAAATNGVLLFDGTSGTEFDKIERPVDTLYFTNNPFLVGNKRAFIEGTFELYPPLTPGAAATSSCDNEVLLLPAGMTVVKDAVAKTTRYNPISTGIKTESAYGWNVDIKKKILGARNNITGLSMTVGDRFKGKARIQGTYTTVINEALPAITVPNVVPAVLTSANGTAHIVSVNGVAVNLLVWAKNLDIDFGNKLVTKEYTSLKVNAIDDRLATFTFRIARTALADFDPWAVRDAGQIITGNIRQLDSNLLYSELGFRGQIENINEVDIDGDAGWELTGPCVASTAGGDEFYIQFGDTNP
jgi:hypothetical protein